MEKAPLESQQLEAEACCLKRSQQPGAYKQWILKLCNKKKPHKNCLTKKKKETEWKIKKRTRDNSQELVVEKVVFFFFFETEV